LKQKESKLGFNKKFDFLPSIVMIDVLTQRISNMQNPAGGTEAEQLNTEDASTPSFGRQFLTSSVVNNGTHSTSSLAADTSSSLNHLETKTSENSVNELSVQSLLLANDRPSRTKFLKSPSDDSLRSSSSGTVSGIRSQPTGAISATDLRSTAFSNVGSTNTPASTQLLRARSQAPSDKKRIHHHTNTTAICDDTPLSALSPATAYTSRATAVTTDPPIALSAPQSRLQPTLSSGSLISQSEQQPTTTNQLNVGTTAAVVAHPLSTGSTGMAASVATSTMPISSSLTADSTSSAASSSSASSSGGLPPNHSLAASWSTTNNNNAQNKGYRPDDAVRIFGSKLTSFEHSEIYNYQRIYFVGSQAKKRGGMSGCANNNGYDDEHGSYILVPHDHVAYRYEILKVIGKGSFGQVIKAYDHKYQQYVALKLVRNEKRFHRQAQEEIRILDHLRRQDSDGSYNIIHMLDHFSFRNHKCITFELMSINLYELIKKNKFQGFNLTLVRKFAHSMLSCLDLLHKNHLIHCDLKPENVLLRTPTRSSIKVIDFGSSCFEDQRIYTYIQSRFYRAPEGKKFLFTA
jgi:tRNA A-37 threonylcarbamoyl transferase component Bud32